MHYYTIQVPALLNPVSIALLIKEVNQAEEQGARFIVLQGGEECFCRGLDLRWVTQHTGQDFLPEMQPYAALLKKLQTGNFIAIAIVKGEAAGGGLGLVCACDYVIANPTSTYSLPEGLLGLIPGMILPALTNKIQPSVIKKMVFTGKKHTSAQALGYQIIDEIVNENELEKSLNAAISTLKHCKQDSVAAIKQLTYNSHLSKDELAVLGMQVLSGKLNETEVQERLQNLVEFMED